MTSHPFHRAIGSFINKEFSKVRGAEVLLDKACDEEGRRVSLFNQTTGTRFRNCDVDILIVIDGMPRVIIEIEESNVKPLHIFGKFSAAALSDSYKDGRMKKPCLFGEPVLFIQILDSSKLMRDSKKQGQWKHIEKQIQDFLKKPWGNIADYELFQGNKQAFVSGGIESEGLVKRVRKFLRGNP